jgi:hypothetical protein
MLARANVHLKLVPVPIMKKQALLAFPEDARLRDRFSYVFSIEVLLAVESSEGLLQSFFSKSLQNHRQPRGAGQTDTGMLAAIVQALKRVRLIPHVINEQQIMNLVKDVLPEAQYVRGSGDMSQVSDILFPHWEWLICIVAFHAVELALKQQRKQSLSAESEVIASLYLVLNNTWHHALPAMWCVEAGVSSGRCDQHGSSGLGLHQFYRFKSVGNSDSMHICIKC